MRQSRWSAAGLVLSVAACGSSSNAAVERRGGSVVKGSVAGQAFAPADGTGLAGQLTVNGASGYEADVALTSWKGACSSVTSESLPPNDAAILIGVAAPQPVQPGTFDVGAGTYPGAIHGRRSRLPDDGTTHGHERHRHVHHRKLDSYRGDGGCRLFERRGERGVLGVRLQRQPVDGRELRQHDGHVSVDRPRFEHEDDAKAGDELLPAVDVIGRPVSAVLVICGQRARRRQWGRPRARWEAWRHRPVRER